MKKNHLSILIICLVAALLVLVILLLPKADAPQPDDTVEGSVQVNEDGYYLHQGHISRVEAPMDQDSLDWAAYVFQSIYDMYLADTGVSIYLSVIPDKNMFLAPDAGVEHLDYEEFYNAVYERTDYMTPIDIRPMLSLSDYYYTDSHWRQEYIVDVAEFIAQSMGVSLPSDSVPETASDSFTGAYYKQYPEQAQAETLEYISSEAIKSFKVTDLSSGKRMSVYDMSKLGGDDPYGMFLGGAMSMITIENPKADNDRELIIFRDSFGSAIAPLLAQGYAKTTIIDLRYITATYMGNFVDFENQDVLFLYSTLLLNSSAGLKK